MRTKHISWYFILVAVLGIVIVANQMTGVALQDKALALVARPAQYLASHTSLVRATVDAIVRWRSLALENEGLRGQNAKLLAQSAFVDQIVRENEFLRRAARVTSARSEVSLPAGVFNIQRSSLGYSATLDKGTTDEVIPGLSVITEAGQLVGRVTNVQAHTSGIQLVNDFGVEIAARVMGTNTSGIAKGRGPDGLALELIAQGEEIHEGDVLVSAGTDAYPAGLILGVIARVVANESGIFQEVNVELSADPLADPRVLVLIP